MSKKILNFLAIVGLIGGAYMIAGQYGLVRSYAQIILGHGELQASCATYSSPAGVRRRITLDWSAPGNINTSNISNIKIYRQVNGVSWQPYTNVASNVGHLVIPDLMPAYSYTFKVVYSKSNGTVAASTNEATISQNSTCK